MFKANTTTMAVVAMLVGMVFAGLPCLEAQAPPLASPMMSPAGVPMAMAPAPDCITALSNVSDCLSYVQVGSNLTAPDKACCPEFAGLLDSNAICLCQLIGSAEGFGVDINRALMLPDACKVEVPSLDACPATPMSAPAPTPSTTSDSPSPGSTAAAPGPDGGVPTALSPGESRNGASSIAVHDLSTLICSAAAIFIAYYF